MAAASLIFSEIFKLIFAKLYDEPATCSRNSPHLRFRNVNTAAQLRGSIKTSSMKPGRKGKLFNSNLDVVNEAFEYLVNKSSKGEKGPYFTPRWVIDLCVRMRNPKETETIIDTALR